MARKAGLTVAINGDASGFSRALRSVRRSIRGFMKSFAGQLAGVFAVTKVASFFSGMIEGFGKIEEASQRLGVSIERTQMLEYAAKQTGFGIDALRSAMQKLTKTAGEAANGNKQAAETFALLGIEVDDLRNLTPDQMLDKVARALKNVDDPLERAALQTKLFGKSGLELNEFLRDYIKLGNTAKASGAIVDEKTVKAAADFGDAIVSIEQGFKAWLSTIPKVREMIELLGGLKEIANADAAAKRDQIYTREQAIAAAAEAVRARGGEWGQSASLYAAARNLSNGGAVPKTAETQKAVSAINEELAKMGLQVFAAKQKKGEWYRFGQDYFAAANPAVEQASKSLTAAEKAAAIERIKASRAAAEEEKKRQAEVRKEAKEAATREAAQKAAEARQKAIAGVVGGAENAAEDARLRAVSPALAEYTAAVRKLADAGYTLTAAEDERLRLAIAERNSLGTKEEIVRESSVPRFIEAVAAGTLEDYKIRAAAGGDIPTKQLKVAEGQAKDVKTIAAEIKKMADGQRNTIGVGAL